MVYLNELMQTHEESLLLEKGELLGLKDLSLGKRNWPEFAIVKMEDVVDQVEVHVLVHICILQALACETRSKEEVGLDVDVEPAVLVICHTPLIVILVLSCLLRLRKEAVHPFTINLCCQLMEFLEGDCFEGGSISFFGINDETCFRL